MEPANIENAAEWPEIALYLELPIEQDWRTIEWLRCSMLERLSAAYGDREGAQRIGMVVSELLENAVKFGLWSRQDSLAGRASLRVESAGRTLAVTVSNPVDAANPGVLELLERLRDIDQTTPEEAYLARIQSLLSDPAAGPGGLGLLRMAYEGGCRISADVKAGGVLHVRADMHL